jgi:uncharacterized protein
MIDSRGLFRPRPENRARNRQTSAWRSSGLIGHRFETIAPMNTVTRITCPVLLVHGSDDRVVPLEDARSIHKRCRDPQTRLLEIDGAGHDSADRIEEHIGELLAFLDDHCTVPSPD